MKTILILLFFFRTIIAFDKYVCLNTTSCSPRLGSEYSEDLCQWKQYGNKANSLCYDRSIPSNEVRHDLGDVQLKAYVAYDRRTLFNVTFSRIEWTDLKLKYKILDSQNTSFCMDFHIKEKEYIMPERSFYYDCPWFDTDSEGHMGTFEYEYSNGSQVSSKKFTYFVTPHEELETANRLFLYVDITSLNKLILMIQMPSEEFGIIEYEIYVRRKRNGVDELVEYGLVPSESNLDGVIEYPYITWMRHGSYYFIVKPHSNSSYSVESFTPKIVIPKSSNQVYIGIVGISVLIPIFLIFMYMWKRNPKEAEQRLLFIYSQSHEAHVNIITTLATLLKTWFGMYIMLFREICVTESKDPGQWFEKAFYNATHVVFFTSPNIVAPSASYTDIYKNLFNLALKRTSAEMCKKDSTKQFLVVSFDYTNEDIIVELINFQRFKLPKDLKKFINVIQNNNFLEHSKRQPGYKKVKTGLKEALQNNQIIRDIFDNVHPDVIVKEGKVQYKLLYQDETKPLTQIVPENSVNNVPKTMPKCTYNFEDVLSDKEDESKPRKESKEKINKNTHILFT